MSPVISINNRDTHSRYSTAERCCSQDEVEHGETTPAFETRVLLLYRQTRTIQCDPWRPVNVQVAQAWQTSWYVKSHPHLRDPAMPVPLARGESGNMRVAIRPLEYVTWSATTAM